MENEGSGEVNRFENWNENSDEITPLNEDKKQEKEEEEEEYEEEEEIKLKNTWIEEIYLKVWKKREKNPLTMKELLERFIEPESPVKKKKIKFSKFYF